MAPEQKPTVDSVTESSSQAGANVPSEQVENVDRTTPSPVSSGAPNVSVNSSATKATGPRPATQTSVSEELATKNFLTTMIVVTSLVLIVGGYFAYSLTGRYIRSSNEIKAQDQLIASLKTKKTDLATLKPAYDQISSRGSGGVSDADLILRALPTTQDYKSLIASLELIGQESGVKVTSVSQSGSAAATTPGPAATTPGPAATTAPSPTAQAFGFSVNLEGPYEKILTFLQSTERSARVLNFTSMTLSGNSGVVTASLTMKTFWQPPADIKSTMRSLQ